MIDDIHPTDRRGWTPVSAILALLLAAGWGWLAYITAIAVQRLGVDAAMDLFASDMTHPWRAQFNTDLIMHFALVAAWILYRTRSRPLAILFALLTLNGALFSFAYMFIVLVSARGDLRKVILGWRAEMNERQFSEV